MFMIWSRNTQLCCPTYLSSICRCLCHLCIHLANKLMFLEFVNQKPLDHSQISSTGSCISLEWVCFNNQLL
uniref:Uncharacterized protein n=1 Tax=Rhizophora mucronata TaxID=61149 RepID=A0A2P2JJW9_RHIMU